MKNDLVALIVSTLRDLHDSGEVVNGAFDAETPLFGQDGILDSLGLVTLVIAVEQAIADKLGVAVSLADEKALSRTQSPYRTVDSLAEYAGLLIEGRA